MEEVTFRDRFGTILQSLFLTCDPLGCNYVSNRKVMIYWDQWMGSELNIDFIRQKK